MEINAFMLLPLPADPLLPEPWWAGLRRWWHGDGLVGVDIYREVDVEADGRERTLCVRASLMCRLAHYLRAWWCPLLYSSCHGPAVAPALADDDFNGGGA
jgi:hypothetical protein